MSQTPPQSAEHSSNKKGTFPGSVSGTYLYVDEEPSWEQGNFDCPPDLRYSVLYLLPRGHFAWFDYWPGFNYGRHAGTFTRNGATLHLQGRASLLSDCLDQSYSGRSFERQVELRERNSQRVLIGLSHREHLFIGWGIHIPFEGPGRDLFPKSWGELQGWIDHFLEATARRGERSS